MSNHNDEASVGRGGGKKVRDNDWYLDGNGTGDSGGGERGGQGSSDSRKARETFTAEQVELYTHRFEEGYDLYDPAYVAWLEATHPEAVPAD